MLVNLTINKTSYLESRYQRTNIVKHGQTVNSSWENVEVGVPQGSILGPLLFLVYINDIKQAVPESNLFVFADDTTVVSKHREIDNLEIDSFEKVNSLAQYFAENKLKLNPNKTKFSCFQTNQRKNSKFFREPSLFIGNEQIESAQVVDFLGVKLDGALDWNEQLLKIEAKVAKGQFVIRNLRRLASIDLLKTIYFCLVESHISYSISLWGATESKLKRVFVAQKKTIRCMLGLPSQTHCREHFKSLKILTVLCIYILDISVYIRSQGL